MSASTAWIRRLVVLTAVASARSAGAAPEPHAAPEVRVIVAPTNGSASSAIVVRNDGTDPLVIDRITEEPGCDAAFVVAPLGGFTLGPLASRSLAIACMPAPAGMQRCAWRARSSNGDVLLAFEAVCAYSDAASLSPSPPAIDLGTVQVGSVKSAAIALRNDGGTTFDKLFVATTDLAGNFAVAAPCNPDARACDAGIARAAPGATTEIVVACTPRTPGAHSADLHIATGAGTRLAMPIALTCSGAPATAPVLSVRPSVVDVGEVELIDARASTTVHIQNAGTDTLRLVDVQIVDEGASTARDWSYTARAPCSPTIPPSCALAAGQTAALDLVFDPAAIGLRDAMLLISFRDTADRTTSIPLRGIGRGATLDLVGGATTLDFGTLPLNRTAALELQLANRGTRELAAGTVAVMPGGPFTVTPAPTFRIPAASSTRFTVTCRPTAAGQFTATARLAASDAPSMPIDLTLRCTGDPAMGITATPPAILLGEVRLAADLVRPIAIASNAPTTVTAQLETVMPSLVLRGAQAPTPTPAMFDLAVNPASDGSLANQLLVAPAGGPPLAIAISGTAVTPIFSVPAAISLGTFCVQQPTTPRIIALTSMGTATIGLAAPALASGDSPFDLEVVAPRAYPTQLPPLQRALTVVTPRRRSLPGLVTDDIVWTTDIPGAVTAQTKLTATFVETGPAIAPDSLSFPDTPIHVDTRNAQQVTLENCDVTPIQLGEPQIEAPFSLDSPPPPGMLRPGQIVTLSVGFHPTRLGEVTKKLTITSPQLGTSLTVTLTGKGVAAGGLDTGDGTTVDLEATSFYACGSCTSGGASGALALALALGLLVRRRRR